jgi:hydrogenase maturation protease
VSSEAVVVIGVGNVYGGDDAAGVLAAEQIRERAEGVDVRICELEPSRLIEAWSGASTVYVVDAVSSGAPPGTVHRFDAANGRLPAPIFGSSSTHALGVADAVELARVLGRLPRRTVVFGIEGETFEAGAPVTPAVVEAAAVVAQAIIEEVTHA